MKMATGELPFKVCSPDDKEKVQRRNARESAPPNTAFDT